MELIGIDEVMSICKVGRATATRLLSCKSCPTLPRKKGQPYRVDKDAFDRWLQSGGGN